MTTTLVSVHPEQLLTFSPDQSTVQLQVTNLTPDKLSFRVKTNKPSLFSVTPSLGTIDPRLTFPVTIKCKDVDDEESKTKKHKFQVIATAPDGREQSVVLGVSIEREEAVSRFVTSVFQDEPVEDIEKTRANMMELQDQSLKMTKEIDRMKMEIQKIEHQLRFRGESKLQTVDVASGYTVFHLFVGFVAGLILAAIIR